MTERMADLVPLDVHDTTAAERREAGIRPTGTEIFDSKTPAEQDAMLGPEAAKLVRDGAVPITDLVKRSPMATEADFITQAPVKDLKSEES